ncbi:MAG: hypothetical protein R3Y61_00270 [Rikenellaceae bacterium]
MRGNEVLGLVARFDLFALWVSGDASTSDVSIPLLPFSMRWVLVALIFIL